MLKDKSWLQRYDENFVHIRAHQQGRVRGSARLLVIELLCGKSVGLMSSDVKHQSRYLDAIIEEMKLLKKLIDE